MLVELTARLLSVQTSLTGIVDKETSRVEDASAVVLVVVPPLTIGVGLAQVQTVARGVNPLDVVLHYSLTSAGQVTPA